MARIRTIARNWYGPDEYPYQASFVGFTRISGSGSFRANATLISGKIASKQIIGASRTGGAASFVDVVVVVLGVNDSTFSSRPGVAGAKLGTTCFTNGIHSGTYSPNGTRWLFWYLPSTSSEGESRKSTLPTRGTRSPSAPRSHSSVAAPMRRCARERGSSPDRGE